MPAKTFVVAEREQRAKPCMSEEDEYVDGTIEARRRSLRYDSSFGIPQIDVNSFVDYLLPPLKGGVNVEEVVSSLKSEGLITSEGKWRYFETNPSERDEPEDIVFGPLAEICERLRHEASKITSHEPTFLFEVLPSPARNPTTTCTARPDGYFILREAEERARHAMDKKAKARWWYDIALTLECKKERGTEDFDENVNKLVFNIQQAMTLDASRRFTFGVTIENTSMRLWLCSRGMTVISEEFDFTSALNLLAHVFLSFSFASKEELGWDLTIRPFIAKDGQRQYEVDVGGETYVTECVFSDSSADALLSRATRVWRARSLRSGESVVLKDAWVEDGRNLEHDIYDALLRDVENKYGVEVRRDVASHLLTPIAHWLVTANGEEDHTTRVITRGFRPSLKRLFDLRMKKSKRPVVMMSAGSGGVSDAEFPFARRELRAPFPRLYRRRFFRRRHYRIVFKEIADALDSVRSLPDVFTVLRDSVEVLKWIHGAGWVHRDISVGNLYLYHGRGLIGDLEYAKRKNFDVAHERRLGTPDFMAIEATVRRFKYLPTESDEEIDAEIAACLSENDAIQRKTQEDDIPPFFHNDLHDLESLWWVAIWELVFHWESKEIRVQGIEAEERDAQREIAMAELFPSADVIDFRRLFLENKAAYRENLIWMPESLWEVRRVLNAFRVLLVRKYREFEAQLPAVTVNAFQGTHESCKRLFNMCRQNAHDIELAPYKTLTSRRVSSCHCSDKEGTEDPAVPSLVPDAGGDDSSEGSLPDVEMRIQPSLSANSKSFHSAKYLANRWRTLEEDFWIPRPSLCVTRYELEVC